jgi:mannose-6-phosphate isomerase
MKELEERPWGSYEVLLDTVYCKVKEIIVQPNQRLSYQSHKHREENWTVTHGILTVVLNDKEHTIYPGESIFIPLGAKHRAWNKIPKPVHFIEVQTGDYFGEDDIIRYEDNYKRN